MPADHFRDHVRDQARIGAQFRVLLGVLIEAEDARAHGVPRGVVAADDEQDQVAEELEGLHVLRVLAVREHGNEIVAGRVPLDSLVPDLREARQTFEQFLAALLVRVDDARARRRRGDVGPAREAPALLEGKVEQGREHHRREFDGDAVDPVEGLADRKIVEHTLRTRADRRLQFGEIARRHHALDGRALLVVLRLVHGDEVRDRQHALGPRLVEGEAERDAVAGQEALVVLVDGEDVVELGDGPVAADPRQFVQVHRILGP